MKGNKNFKYLLLALTGMLISCESNGLNSDSLSNTIPSDVTSDTNSSINSGSDNNSSSTTTPTQSNYSSKDQALLNEYFDFDIPYVKEASSYTLEDFSDEYNSGYAMVSILFEGVNQSIYNSLVSTMEKDFSYIFSYVDSTYGDTYKCFLDSSNKIALETTYYEDDGNYIELSIFDLTSELGNEINNNKLTTADQNTLKSYLGFDFPVVGDYYTFDDYTYYYGDTYVSLYYNYVTSDEYNSLLDLLEDKISYDGTETDEDGFTWDSYSNTSIVINLSFVKTDYYYSYVCIEIASTTFIDSGDDNTGGDNTGGEDTVKDFVNGNFASSDLALLNSYFDFTIPTVGTQYYITDETTSYGVNVYIDYFSLTKAEFDTFGNALKKSFTFDESGTYDGLPYYSYSKDDFYIDVYYYSDYDCIEMNIFDKSLLDDSTGDDNTGGDNTGGDNTDDYDNGTLLTNNNKGLPTGENGIYNVNFKADGVLVKNVTELGDYENGCPTTGSPSVLVVPVEFSDSLASTKGYTIDNIKNAFLPSKETKADLPYYSVYDYFYKSSNEQLTLDIDVLDFWYTAKEESTYYENYKYDYTDGYQTYKLDIGDQVLIDEVLKYLDTDKDVDLSKYDSNKDGTIDSIVIINTLTINYDTTINWAYRYWNFYNANEGDYYYYDNVCANDYLWASYQFLFEDEKGFEGKNPTNTYTYIHEFSHILGADDYYDTSENRNHPLEGYDIMDSKTADHSPFTKFNLGWITESRLIVADSDVEVTLNAFEETGDTIIIANNFSTELGMYQEYWIVCYYNNTGLNANGYGLFDDAGIVVYHINASLFLYDKYDPSDINEKDYYSIHNSNTDASDEYGSEENLIELVKNDNGYVYKLNDSLSSSTKDDSNNVIAYTFKVMSLDSNTATLKFSKNSSTNSNIHSTSTNYGSDESLGWL